MRARGSLPIYGTACIDGGATPSTTLSSGSRVIRGCTVYGAIGLRASWSALLPTTADKGLEMMNRLFSWMSSNNISILSWYRPICLCLKVTCTVTGVIVVILRFAPSIVTSNLVMQLHQWAEWDSRLYVHRIEFILLVFG